MGLESRVYPPGRHMRVGFQLMHLLTSTDVIIMNYIIYCMETNIKEDNIDGPRDWFFCSHREMMIDLNMSKATIWRSLRELRKMGLIATERETKWQPKNKVKVNWSKLILEIESTNHQFQNSNSGSAKIKERKVSPPTPPSYKRKKTETVACELKPNSSELSSEISSKKLKYKKAKSSENSKISPKNLKESYSKKRGEFRRKNYSSNGQPRSDNYIKNGELNLVSNNGANIKKPNKIDRRFAKQLFEALKEKHKIMSRVDICKWAESFRLLRGSAPQTRIEDTLDWYCKNIGRKYTPHAFSASGFRKKFISIEQLMLVEKEDNANSLPEVASDRAFQIADYYLCDYWPKDSFSKLPYLVEEALFEHREIVIKCRKMIESKGKYSRIAERCLGIINTADLFIWEWLRKVNTKIVAWEDWSGNMEQFRIRRDSKWFRSQVSNELIKYGFSPEVVKSFLDKLGRM